MKFSYGTYDRFLEYRAVIMRAIAMAWRDPVFAQGLVDDPVGSLKKAFGYDFPFPNMRVSVLPDSANWNGKGLADWHVDETNVLQLVLPPAPPAEQRVEALAAFNAVHLSFLHD